MTILAYGLNYRTASLDLRERIAFPESEVRAALRQVVADVDAVQEAAILSTCNRTELYCALKPGTDPDLSHWLSSQRAIQVDELEAVAYHHWDTDAAKHQIRVACGLDSQVLGEPQIMGQVKTAYALARDTGTLGPELNLLSQIILRTAKEVRTQTDIGRNPISVAYAAVAMAQQIFNNLSDKRALLVGAGETIDLVAEHLRGQGIGEIAIANRTLANAELLAAKYNAEAMQLTDVAERLAEFDVVISSTGASLPVIGKGAVEAAIKQRRHKPIFMVDIAVPRDIEVEVGELPDVYLYSIDDLSQIIETNLAQRRDAAQEAETFIAQGAQHYQRERRVQLSQEVLTQFRNQAKTTQEDELARAVKDLQRGTDPEEVLARLSHNLTNKLIHTPTSAIREASAEGRTEFLEFCRTLFGLDESQNKEH
ncbi:MAG: glutamyl-tRNA reductase [Limisphaerales bacterium]|jgi:glutamyl-tRNA reductase